MTRESLRRTVRRTASGARPLRRSVPTIEEKAKYATVLVGWLKTMRNQQLELKIVSDIVKRFAHMQQSMTRRALLIKFINQPTSDAITYLLNGRVIRRKGHITATVDDEYLPMAAAFELCDDPQLREEARRAATIVLHTLQQMFIGEPKKEGYVFEDLDRHVSEIYPNQLFEGTARWKLH
jgi:hypothetical protein